ncbi:MAG: AraC family transcriptional regulator [Bacteroidota bacterium]
MAFSPQDNEFMKPVLERLPLGPQQSILAFHYDEPHFATPWHFHPQHELTYIRESSGTKLIGDFVGNYAAGELVLLRSNVPHCWKNQAEREAYARSTVIQWMPGIFAKVPELKQLFALLEDASRGLLFSAEGTAALREDLVRLPTLSNGEQYTALLDVLVRLTQDEPQRLSQSSFRKDLSGPNVTRMATVQDFVAANYNRRIYLREVAALVNLTEQSFSRFFSKLMGRPFFTFLNEYRANAASRLLINTDRSVAEIGYACGYDSLPFFYQQFRKHHGMSPAKYRKQHQRN